MILMLLYDCRHTTTLILVEAEKNQQQLRQNAFMSSLYGAVPSL